LKPGGILALFFNSKDRESWNFLNQIMLSAPEINFRGYFPMKYSSNSVVQDNRSGSLKHDFVLIYQKSGKIALEVFQSLTVIPGWRSEFPDYAEN
ncbi:MAG: type II modification methylase, partial [Trichodesmium sp. St16_bin4-tuft]|nr:type II modification methylase [Trichodesmium sp. St16_bin4-tuft]